MPALPPHDHKRIAVRTALAASIFLFVGFALVLVLRWQLAYPGPPLPLRAFGLGLIAFEIACSQLCGAGHYRMRGVIDVMNAPTSLVHS
jgi:hypothetical protein